MKMQPDPAQADIIAIMTEAGAEPAAVGLVLEGTRLGLLGWWSKYRYRAVLVVDGSTFLGPWRDTEAAGELDMRRLGALLAHSYSLELAAPASA